MEKTYKGFESSNLSMTNRDYKILMILLAITIVGEVASIAIWYSLPDMRMTLIVDYTTASVAAAVAAVLNIVALIGVLRKSKWGSLLVIAVSIPNRIIGLFIFETPATTGIFAIWTALLVIFAYMNYREIT
jgi:hypothetical protein